MGKAWIPLVVTQLLGYYRQMKSFTTKPLTEAPVTGSVSSEYFYRMLSPYSLKLSKPYNDEENEHLEACLQHMPGIRDMCFVAVGGGELWQLRRALKYAKSYVCIEPLTDVFVNDSVQCLVEQHARVSCVAKRFNDVERNDLPDGPAFLMFTFNIFAYLENPVQSINDLCHPGDILFITTWADSHKARQTRQSYFEYLNRPEEEIVIDPNETIGLTHLEVFPFDKLRHYERHEYITGNITNTLIIYA